ncbi:MAG: TIGR04086 family membrane protein [Clostridiales bacterium]|nr:TIGR04086 family membrane protein [Clostridiales bacterium]
MKMKAVLKSLFLSYGLTGILLLVLAFLLFRFDLGEGPFAAGILVIYVASCLGGGFLAGKTLRRKKYLWGMTVGICYYILLLTVSFAVSRGWDMSLLHGVTMFFLCLGGGALGGMLS